MKLPKRKICIKSAIQHCMLMQVSDVERAKARRHFRQSEHYQNKRLATPAYRSSQCSLQIALSYVSKNIKGKQNLPYLYKHDNTFAKYFIYGDFVVVVTLKNLLLQKFPSGEMECFLGPIKPAAIQPFLTCKQKAKVPISSEQLLQHEISRVN